MKAENTPKLQTQEFPTYLDAPDVSSEARTLCEILARASPVDLESSLSSSGVTPTSDIVEQVLKLSYNSPSSAIKFFRWAKHHSPYSWNLIIDLLGKNHLFDSMWDALRSARQQGFLSMPTFASVFGSYCLAHRFTEAVKSFDVMDKYGIPRDVIAVNTLLSAICMQPNQTTTALEFFHRIKSEIPPDGDTFAILFEGCEKEGDLGLARRIFNEMVELFGWRRDYISAYEVYLNSLFQIPTHIDEAFEVLRLSQKHHCMPGLKFFSNVLDILVELNDTTRALVLFEIMTSEGLAPTLIMYNLVISLLCYNKDIENAIRLLDEMVLYRVFPDYVTYNMVFRCLVCNKKTQLVGKLFVEMIKNESPPTHVNCAAAITMLLKEEDPEMAIEIWNFLLENDTLNLETAANALLLGLCNMGRLSQVKSFAEDMLDKKIKLHEATMGHLKHAFYKEGRNRRDKFDSLSRRWKAS